MDAEQFLERVVAPGGFIAVAFKSPGKGMGHRFFQRTDAKGAAGYIKWAAQKGMDVWHAMGSYAQATPKINGQGHQVYEGKRIQENVQSLRAFWLDMDIKRDGDGKDPSKVYADLGAAVTWLKQFMATTAMPPPNLWVNSGYGIHLYWVVEDPMDPATWQPYAEALKAAVLATNGYGCDLNVVADSARILRPPESLNFKVPTSPAPVSVLSGQSRSDYPNDLIYQALQPYLGQIPSAASTTVGNALAGAPPALAGKSALNTAAQSGALPVIKDKSFALIAQKCLQVKHSLANNGATDNRPTWYLGHLSLAHHCYDGDQFVHEISKGYPGYSQANTDAEVARIAAEKLKNNSGPPRCTTYNANNPGVCQGCPFWGKVVSPWHLGAQDGDLPKGYRRDAGKIQKARPGKDGLIDWHDVIVGDVHSPTLDRKGSKFTLNFIYELAGHSFAITANNKEAAGDITAVIATFSEQGVTLNRDNAQLFGAFVVAWINKLRIDQAERDAAIEPFGWAEDPQGGHVGFAIGGRLYKPDGSQEIAPGVDPEIMDAYRPRGSLDRWKRAAAFVTKDRPDLQVLLAAALGAPLMKFTGESGLVMGFISRDSAVGKSSACKVGQSAWSTLNMMASMDDTTNAVRKRVADARVMPCIWDELQLDQENSRAAVRLFFEMSQGKDKARLHANASLQKMGNWRTIMIMTSNRSAMDFVAAETAHTDAGAMRLLEFNLVKPAMALDVTAGSVIEDGVSCSGQAGLVLGEFFARYQPLMKSCIHKSLQQWATHLPEPAERFYRAGLACVMTAAAVAKQLQLVDFDLQAMRDFILEHLGKAREYRAQNCVVNNGEIDIQNVFGRFMADMDPRTAITSMYVGRGSPPKGFKILAQPANTRDPLAVHISAQDGIVRFRRDIFAVWCRHQRISPSEVLSEMAKKWGAIQKKLKFGAGVVGGAMVTCVDVSFVANPELADYAPNAGQPATDPVKQAPAQALRGNQPRV